MNLEDYLVGESQAVASAYTCPISGTVAPAFCMAWVAGDPRFDADFIHAEVLLDRNREDAGADTSVAPDWSPDCEAAKMIRARRRQLLHESDWTQGLDSPLDESTRSAWAAYRQALRDLTADYASPDLVVWPSQP